MDQKKSVYEMSKELKCSENKINYWLSKYRIKKRSISDAVYIKVNSNGDLFSSSKFKTNHDWFLYGMGLGLYWGEGIKADRHSVRLGNTDPALIKMLSNFLR